MAFSLACMVRGTPRINRTDVSFFSSSDRLGLGSGYLRTA